MRPARKLCRSCGSVPCRCGFSGLPLHWALFVSLAFRRGCLVTVEALGGGHVAIGVNLRGRDAFGVCAPEESAVRAARNALV